MAAPRPVHYLFLCRTTVPDPLSRYLRWLLLLLAFSGAFPSTAQHDSLAMYKDIQQYVGKHKVTRWIYDAIFVPPVSDQEPEAAKVPPRRVDPNLKFKGRIIRVIDVRVLDPFGFSVDDTTQHPISGIQRLGNRLHRRTRERVVRNILLFEEMEALDPLNIAESERVLRASPAVNDAAIYVQPVKHAKDSVDVIVLVHDQWNLEVSGEGDLSSASVTLRDRNLLGWGQELEQHVYYELGLPRPELSGHHTIYNIKGSHITSTLSYSSAPGLGQLGLELDRPFYSPLAQWAGGLSLSRTWSQDVRADASTGGVITSPLSPVAFDTWLAHGFVLGEGNTPASRSSRFIVGTRYAQTRFASRPSFQDDTLHVNSNSSLYLIGVGLSVRQYYKERFLFRFGATEDMPEGLLCTLTTGVQKRELSATLPYLGLEVSRGANTDHLGYVSATLGYGTFFGQGEASDGTLSADINYFTDVHGLGRWKYRQFVRARSTIGFNKPVTTRLTLGGEELYGFDPGVLHGTHKQLLNLETVFYAPYQLLGFRFAPAFLAGLGTIGEEGDPLLSGPIFSAWSLGLLLRNENLLVSTIELAVVYYPSLPDGNRSVLRMGPSVSFILGRRDFAFVEPHLVPF